MSNSGRLGEQSAPAAHEPSAGGGWKQGLIGTASSLSRMGSGSHAVGEQLGFAVSAVGSEAIPGGAADLPGVTSVCLRTRTPRSTRYGAKLFGTVSGSRRRGRFARTGIACG